MRLLAARFAALLLLAAPAAAQQVRPGSGGTTIDPNAPRPIDALESVWIEELTFMEVRSAEGAVVEWACSVADRRLR